MAGAIPAEQYVGGLKDAGLQNVIAVDDNADLNAYTKVEGQSACCSPVSVPRGGLTIISSGCCSSDEPMTVHDDLAKLLEKFDINEFAASVRVYATKPV